MTTTKTEWQRPQLNDNGHYRMTNTEVYVILYMGRRFVNQYFVYILTNWNNKVMYIGMTNDLHRRLYEHKHQLVDGFTKRYNVHKLVYFEQTANVHEAIVREKQLKGLLRAKKNAIVETINPQWKDLSEEWE